MDVNQTEILNKIRVEGAALPKKGSIFVKDAFTLAITPFDKSVSFFFFLLLLLFHKLPVLSFVLTFFDCCDGVSALAYT